jgi:putative oxidoreductase
MKKLFSTKYSNTGFNLSMFFLRLGFGLMIITNHGMVKLMHFAEKSAGFYDPLHISSKGSLLLVIFAEVFCALMVILGLFTRAAVIPLIITMLVVIFMVQRNQPFKESEDAILYLSAFLAILICGPGRISVDGMMGK